MGRLKHAELAAAAVLLALAVGVVVFSQGLRIWAGPTPGPRFVPLLIAGAVAALALLMGLRALRDPGETAADWPRGAALFRVLGVAAAIAAFAALGPTLGFVPAAFLFILAVLLAVLRCPILPSLLAAGITTGVIWAIFIGWLGIRLPAGPFGF